MCTRTTKSSTTSGPLDDIEFLVRSDHRVTALAALARRPQSRNDLRTMTGVSQSTIGRTLSAFEDRNWIRRDWKHYEATQLGAFVAAGMRESVDRVETERTLRDVWQWLPDETSGFAVEMIADAVVTVAAADDPYRPVNRFMSLLRETDRFRFAGFDEFVPDGGLQIADPDTEQVWFWYNPSVDCIVQEELAPYDVRGVFATKDDAYRFLDWYAEQYGVVDTSHLELCRADLALEGFGRTRLDEESARAKEPPEQVDFDAF